MALVQNLDWDLIELPRRMDVDDAEELFRHIGRRIPATVSWTIQQQRSTGNIIYPSDDSPLPGIVAPASTTEVLQVFSIQKGTLSFKLTIYPRSSDLGPIAEPFTTIPDGEDSSYIRAMRYETILGYAMHEHRPEVVQLVERVRTAVADYSRIRP
jgi:hypothetical protein